MDIFTTSLQLGAVSAIIIQLIKFLPFIDTNNKQHKRFAALFVTLLAVLVYGIYENNIFGLGNFLGILLGSLISAFALYKTIIQTIDEEIKTILLKVRNRREIRANQKIAAIKT